MHGHPEDARSTVRLVRRAEGRRAQSLTLMVVLATIASAIAEIAIGTRGSGSGATAIDTGVASIASVGIPSRETDGGGATMSPGARSPAPSPTPPPLAACRYADEPAAHVAYDDWQRTIVDTTSRLPKGYVPPDLVTVSRAGLSGRGSIRLIAIADLKALAVAAGKARARLAVESAYRSEARQQRTFAGWARTSGDAEARRFSARAGHSEHQLGTAIDFKVAGGGSPWTRAFAHSLQARWLAANAWRFGWIQSYPAGAETQTCYGREAWHYRYVGRQVAAEVHVSGMTLRAWLWLHASTD